MTGIVLAAEMDYTFLGKWLMPLDSKSIMIDSAISFCQDFCNEIIIVVDHDGPLEYILRPRYKNEDYIRFVYQPRRLGIPDAIARAACAATHKNLFVTFGDNFYSQEKELPLINLDKSVAIIRDTDLPNLIFYDSTEKVWGKSCDNSFASYKRFGGWMTLTKEQGMLGSSKYSLAEYLNRLKMEPLEIGIDSEWWDLGTIENYVAFLQNHED